MLIVHLDNRALIDLSAPEAEHFLQNIVTTDLTGLGESEALPGALLAPQGKILFDFLVSRGGEGKLRLECRADIADDFIRRLMLYRLRAKVQIGKSGKFVGQQSIQLHGGIGMTQEAKIGHYFKRLTMIENTFGDTDYHLRRVTESGGLV